MKKEQLKSIALKLGKHYLDKAMDEYVKPYYEARRPPPVPGVAAAMDPDLNMVRDKVAGVVEESLAKVVWKPRMRTEDGGQDPVDEAKEEFMITQIVPVVIAETGTYTLMVSVFEKDTTLEKDVMSLTQFLTNFIPMREITISDTN